ncbi:hypothetical protein MUK42_34259 [Musa troglodytarum]|uniref:Uncharacterized protein n=1 Tax=Musa troglodytarum TaxID=320322 RepID=A0A9E7GGL4_9LILI|nr:hypothetical protein MUK42_34259 [Musa troglodytarum]
MENLHPSHAIVLKMMMGYAQLRGHYSYIRIMVPSEKGQRKVKMPCPFRHIITSIFSPLSC